MTAPQIKTGYHPGLLARIVGLHIDYYHALIGFDQPFESLVASGMAEFLGRLDRPMNESWSVHDAGEILGGISIDGEDLGPGIAHLRWFIMADSLQGQGMGNQLMTKAMGFCKEQGFREIHLWTFDLLPAARRLYEKHGFELVEETPGAQWGKTVTEQKFVWTHP